MKKIVFLRINPKALGGAEIYLSRLRKVLNEENIKTKIKSLRTKKWLASWIKALKFNKRVCKNKAKDEIYFSLERVKCADIYRAGDGVHKIYRATKIFWWVNPLNFVLPYLEKKCFLNSKKIITNSNFIKNQIIQSYKIDESKIITIYNGINLPKKIEKGSAKIALCKELGLNYELPTILFVGNGFKRKGLKEFLIILSKLKSPYNAVIVGKDKNLQEYKNLSKKLKLNTVFVGAQRVVNKYYEASDLFLFPTKYEPFSNVVLEAMSYKNVVITTDQNGASEVIDDRFVLKKDNEDEIIKLIEEILSNQEFANLIAEKNYLKSLDFSIEKNAKETIKIIKEVMD